MVAPRGESHGRPDGTPRRLPRAARVVLTGVEAGLVVLAVAVAVWLWPARLGGATTLVVVAGHSMEPTHRFGDLAVARKGQPARVGDVIVYRVPAGEPGAGGTVIHRVVGGDGAGGYVTRGDNSSHDDIWRPTDREVVGRVEHVIPSGGTVLMRLVSPLGIASVATAVLLWAIWPRRSEHEQLGGPVPATSERHG